MSLVQIFPLWFFQWCQHTFIGVFLDKSQWAFAIIETFHIVCLSILLGSTLVVDLRLLGKGMTRDSVAHLSSTLLPWTYSALAGIVFTGILMFDSEAVKMGRNSAFFLKMIFLSLAVLIQLTIHRQVTASRAVEGTATAKVAAALSLCSWLGVALAGRAIAFA